MLWGTVSTLWEAVNDIKASGSRTDTIKSNDCSNFNQEVVLSFSTTKGSPWHFASIFQLKLPTALLSHSDRNSDVNISNPLTTSNSKIASALCAVDASVSSVEGRFDRTGP